MTKIVPKIFSQHIAEQFVESINEPANNIYYIAASKHTPYSTGDDTLPQPTESIRETQVEPYEEILFGKKINASDVSLMIPRYNWTTNTVYTSYSDVDSELLNRQFYVVSSSGSFYYVYKVLENNGGRPSTVNPISSTSESACNFITTGDNYKWKLMYRLSSAQFEKFATSSYMPVATSSNVASIAVDGAIDAFRIISPGSRYVSTISGTFNSTDVRESIPGISGSILNYRLNSNSSSNSDFYVGSALYISAGTGSGQQRSIVAYNGSTKVVTVDSAFSTPPASGSQYIVAPDVVVTGDGSGVRAYAQTASNSTVNNFISSVVITTRGSGYTYASAVVRGNTGGVSVNTNIVPVISPVGGHGSKAPEELGCDLVCISTSFSNSESGFIPTANDYRKTLVIKDPLFTSVHMQLSSETGSFGNGEKVHQIQYATLTGTVSCNTTSTTITGSATEFSNSLSPGDYVLIFDSATSTKSLRVVDSVTNSTSISLTDEPTFVTSFGTIAKVNIQATGIKSGNASPYITLSNTEPKFGVGKVIVGEQSGALAIIDSIDVNEKSFNNWSTFDNRTRISYTSNSLSFSSDAVVYQDSIEVSNAYFHSANATYVFLTSEKGPINADPSAPLLQLNGSAVYDLGSVKYTSDIVKKSGEVIYIENYEPITRSGSQTESFRIILKF